MYDKGEKYFIEGFLLVILKGTKVYPLGKREFLKMLSLSFRKAKMEREKRKKEYG